MSERTETIYRVARMVRERREQQQEHPPDDRTAQFRVGVLEAYRDIERRLLKVADGELELPSLDE